MQGIQKIIDFFTQYTDNFSLLGTIKLVIDILLVIALIVFILVFLSKRKKVQLRKLVILLLISLLSILVCYIFSLTLLKYLVSLIILMLIVMICVSYAQDMRHYLENTSNNSKNTKSFSTTEEKKAVISIICSTAQYLSKRKIGALITIERNDSMNEYIQNAIDIRSVVSQEIMTTIFTPGTACHDGAIIIRKNIIMCAGAYYPSTLKYDVPKALGSRHRAAIGISEHVDALTVVVSEQTGNVSVTLDGIIYSNLSGEELQEMLDTHLLEEQE